MEASDAPNSEEAVNTVMKIMQATALSHLCSLSLSPSLSLSHTLSLCLCLWLGKEWPGVFTVLRCVTVRCRVAGCGFKRRLQPVLEVFPSSDRLQMNCQHILTSLLGE